MDLQQMDRMIQLTDADIDFLLYLGDWLKEHGLSLSQLMEDYDADMQQVQSG